MKRVFLIIFYFLFLVISSYCEIFKGKEIDENVGYAFVPINKEKGRFILKMNKTIFEEEFFYAYENGNEIIELPLPIYLGEYKNSVIFIKGNGSSYREILVYTNDGDRITKTCFENLLSISDLPREYEQYIFIYQTHPIVITSRIETLLFMELNVAISEEVRRIELLDNEALVETVTGKVILKL